MSAITQAVAELQTATATLSDLVAEGWALVRTPNFATVTITSGAITPLLERIRALEPIGATVTARAVVGDDAAEIEVNSAGHRVVTSVPGNLLAAFGRELRSTANRAASGNADAMASLPADWKLVVRCDLRLPLRRADDRAEWTLLQNIADFHALLDATPVWDARAIFGSEKAPIFVITSLEPESYLQLGRGAVVGLHSANISKFADMLGAGGPSLSPSALPSGVLPKQLQPLSGSEDLASSKERMTRLAVGTAWLALSTNVNLNEAQVGCVNVEIFGLQRVRHAIASSGLDVSEENARASLDLYDWASEPNAVDQQIAIDQVASLYRDDPPWSSAVDVLQAARDVCATLRRNTIGEVLLARRAARSTAIAAAAQASERTSTMVKNTAERCIASLLAVGGVIAGRSVAALSESQAESLQLLIALFLFGLAIWSLLFESLPARAPLRSFRQDIGSIADLLSIEERNEVLSLAAIKSAERFTTLMNFVLPATYVAVGVIALIAPA